MARFERLGWALTAAGALSACAGGAPPALPPAAPALGAPLAPAKSAWPISGAKFSYAGSVHETIAAPNPSQRTLQVTQTMPGARGDTVKNVNKPATLETGLEVMVPPFAEQGDRIEVDTRTGEYLGRVK